MSAPAATAPLVRAGYALLRSGGPAVARGRACLMWVEGPDAASFLHGLLSNDVEGLVDGEARPALILDAKGHIQVDLRVRRDGADAFTLIAPAALGCRLYPSDAADVPTRGDTCGRPNSE